jgi:PKD repeat protein
MPPVASFSYLAECTGEVNFSDLSTNNPNSWSWDFGDGNTSNLENPTHIFTASGTYTVELTSTNGIGSGTETINVTIDLPDAPTASNVDICENQEASFTGSGSGTLMWYDDSGTTLLETGNTFVTSPLNTTTNYLVQNVLQTVDYVGPVNGSIGSGNAHSQLDVYTLNFEAQTSFDIVSVWVNANSTGNRTINIYDGVDGGGTIIDQVMVFIPNTGAQRITLDLTIPSAGTYSIGGSSMDLYRNNGGVNYPYSLANVVDIVSSSVGPNYYYYYYDWEVHTNPCLSPFTPVVANVNPSSYGTDTQTSCDSYTWIDGNTYTSNNGNATYTLQNSNGCDSIVTLDLTINDLSFGTDVQSACGSYTWIDGNTYTSNNGNATHTLQNAAGCDSIVTLDLTINNPSFGTDVHSACGSYTWIDGNTYTSSNGNATYTLQNTNGCDSIITLDLTIHDPSFGTDIQTACSSYTWVDGNTYTSSNNTATYVLQNVNGCDSTVTLDLTITGTVSSTDTQTACESYTWIDGNTYTQSNNTATFTLIASQGCDSIVTLNLSINNPDFVTDAQVSCDSYTWIDGHTYTQSNNTASMTLQNQNGCDSTVTLDLTINTVNNTIIQLDPSTAQAEASNATYQWLDCANGFVEFAGETGQTFQCQGACYFEVAVLVTENGCSDTSDCVILNVLDLNDNTTQESVTVYPNPTSKTLNINGLHTLAEIRRIDVTDYNGRLVKSLDQIITTIDVSNLADGIYFLNINHEDGVEIKKFIIE